MRVKAEEFREGYEALAEIAAREPVVITNDGKDTLVVVSAREWTRLHHGDRRVGATSELSEEWLRALDTAHVPSSFEHLNADMT